MKCLRCGRCCFYSVVVIHPDSVKEDLDANSIDLTEKDLLCLDGSEKCPYLTWHGDKASCNIHHYKWFKDTPCGLHTQEIERADTDPCRTGVYMFKNPVLHKKLTLRV